MASENGIHRSGEEMWKWKPHLSKFCLSFLAFLRVVRNKWIVLNKFAVSIRKGVQAAAHTTVIQGLRCSNIQIKSSVVLDACWTCTSTEKCQIHLTYLEAISFPLLVARGTGPLCLSVVLRFLISLSFWYCHYISLRWKEKKTSS